MRMANPNCAWSDHRFLPRTPFIRPPQVGHGQVSARMTAVAVHGVAIDFFRERAAAAIERGEDASGLNRQNRRDGKHRRGSAEDDGFQFGMGHAVFLFSWLQKRQKYESGYLAPGLKAQEIPAATGGAAARSTCENG